MFSKILIANRGEIACRVIATAKRMGIATVAVYSDADRNARHVELADESVHIGASASRESYLRGDKIIAACQATGAEAVHPGYGFLSENEAFAREVEEAGIVFIGPKHASIAAMGDKIASKKLAHAAKVNTIPGWNDAIESAERAVEIAREIGHPVMIKASAGGGGKGLRVAHDDTEAFEGFTSCRNEAKASFGDDRVFIEKFVVEPRHIEIQVLGDAHGNTIYLNERECSIQRRHQKVIEEAPSPFISDATRKAMGEQAVALAKAVNYQSAGTVEFVVGKDQSFYFLEMNTRLQVEHPVTELITGLDLVELMIRVAAGEKLPLTQAEVRRDGWAIECRINAEDPVRNFLPSTGRLVRFQPPKATLFAGGRTTTVHPELVEGGLRQAQPERVGTRDGGDVGTSGVRRGTVGVRVDTGVEDGGEIPMFYDSMIAKLIVHGEGRADAIERMRDALDAFVIRGVSSNIGFQAALLAHPQFRSGDFDTGFIAKHFQGGFDPNAVTADDPQLLFALAAYAHRRHLERATGIGGQLAGHEYVIGDTFVVWPIAAGDGVSPQTVTITDFEAGSGKSRVDTGSTSYEIDSKWHLGAGRMRGTVNGRPFAARIERGLPGKPLALRVSHRGAQLDALVLTPRAAELQALMPHKAPPDLSRFLLSPMPGLLVQLLVEPGQKVRAGERLAVIEAMKMENVLVAASDATVSEVRAKPGDSLVVDQPICEFAA